MNTSKQLKVFSLNILSIDSCGSATGHSGSGLKRSSAQRVPSPVAEWAQPLIAAGAAAQGARPPTLVRQLRAVPSREGSQDLSRNSSSPAYSGHGDRANGMYEYGFDHPTSSSAHAR